MHEIVSAVNTKMAALIMKTTPLWELYKVQEANCKMKVARGGMKCSLIVITNN